MSHEDTTGKVVIKGTGPRPAPPKVEDSGKPPGAKPVMNPTLEPGVGIQAGGTPRAAHPKDTESRKPPGAKPARETLSKLI